MACKSTLDTSGVIPVVKVPSASLPMNCVLQNPPAGVSIAEVEFFPSGSDAGSSYTVTGGNTFTVPAMATGATGNLLVRIIGSYSLGTTVYVVEDCDAQTPILAITDRLSKAAYAVLEVK
jgi:hypothetical protein